MIINHYYAVQPPDKNNNWIGSIVSIQVFVVPLIAGKEPKVLDEKHGCYHANLSGLVSNVLVNLERTKGLIWFENGLIVEYDSVKKNTLMELIPVENPAIDVDTLMEELRQARALKQEEEKAAKKSVLKNYAKNLLGS